MLKTETVKRIKTNAKIAYHTLALGLYSGQIASRGRPVDEEIREFVSEYTKRLFGERLRGWRNILKTKEQKRLAIDHMTWLYSCEFGEETDQFAIANRA